jgi:hypothetical protein
MANVALRSAFLLAFLACSGLAFRHNLASIQKHLDDAEEEARPPNIDEMMAKALEVSAAKLAQAEKAADDAQQALMAQMNPASRSNNTRKRNSSHSAVDDLWAANEARFVAAEVEAKVKQMKQVCAALIAAVLDFRKNSEARFNWQSATSKITQKREHQELVNTVIEDEKLDLRRLLGLLDAIATAKGEVIELDNGVKSGAADAIAQATNLVDSMGAQLQTRFGTLESVDAAAFTALELQPPNAELIVDASSARSLDAADKEIVRLSQAVNREYQASQAALQESFAQRKTNTTSKEALKARMDRIYELNQKLFDAKMLQEKITETVQLITEFFEELGKYRVKQAGQAQAAAMGARRIKRKGEEVRRGIEEGLLADGGVFFHLYQTMWVRHNQAKEVIPGDDEEYEPVSSSITDTAQKIHEWLNGEMVHYCVKYTPSSEVVTEANTKCADLSGGKHVTCARHCQDARSRLIKSVDWLKKREAEVNWCDERFTKTYCIEANGGLAPNGKACKWTDGDFTGKTGIRGRCDPNRAPTHGLPYGRGDADGAGIFF